MASLKSYIFAYMNRKGITRNYTWLLHIAIWVVLFGMPFFSPRPGHPLHGGVNYARFIPTLVSFLIIFYINYFLLIKKYLFDRKFGLFILWNILLIAAACALVHLTFKFVYPASAEMPPPPAERLFPGGGPGHGGDRGPGGPGDHGPGFRGRPPRETLGSINFIVRNSLIYIGIIFAAVAMRMTGRWYKDENKRQEMEKAAAEAEIATLKSQINPHFLFNTLNNIYSLIQIDQDKAQEAVHDLSGMLRYVLYDSEKPSVPLSSESAFLRDYVKLMSMRCPSNVKLEVSLPGNESGTKVAPLLFIPLVENAFKHGISPEEASSIKVDLREDGDYVVCLVENTCFPKDEADRSGSGIGLKNLARRLDMLYPGKYSFEYGKVENLYRSLLRINTNA